MNYSVISEGLIIITGYLLTWILVVTFGKIEVVKLATLILAQVFTAIYLASTFVINLIPLYKLEQFFSDVDIKEASLLYGYDVRNLVDIFIQFLTYPIIISALLTYIIAEYRQIKRNNTIQ